MKHLIMALCACIALQAGAQVTGKWKTIDDETGKPKSIVEITERDGKLFGTIVKLFRGPDEDQDPICTECDDDRKDQRIIGMEIIRDLEADGDEWAEGTICDPKTGKVYDCKLWVDEENQNQLNVRGYLFFIYRTQYWVRID